MEAADKGLTEALRTLSQGSRFIVYSVILEIVAALLIIAAVIGGLLGGLRAGESYGGLAGVIVSAGLVGLLGLALLLVAFIVYFVGVRRIMVSISEIVAVAGVGGLAHTGAKAMYYGLIAILVGIILIILGAGTTLVVAPLAVLAALGLVPLILGGIALIIGQILFGIGVRDLDNKWSGFSTPGLLIAVGTIVSFIPYIGFIGLIIVVIGFWLLSNSARVVVERYATERAT